MQSTAGRQIAWVALLALMFVAVAAGAATQGASAQSGAAGPAQQSFDPDGVLMEATLRADGDADWRVVYRLRLETDDEAAAFADLQRDVRANGSVYAARFRERTNATVAGAAAETGRSMAIRNVTVSARNRTLPREYGVVTYRFRWTNFAATNGSRLRAGDALRGIFLDNETTLSMAWPEGDEATAVAPAPDGRSARAVRWRGPREFGPGEPSVVAAPAGDEPAGGGLQPALAVAAVLAVLGAGAVGLAARRRDWVGPASAGAGDGESRGSADDGGSSRTAGAPESEEGTANGSVTDGPPSELLSNEERVLRLLEAGDGRVKQQTVAAELDWTAAKTSQVIGDMREAGAVQTFRLGRENVVTLPGTDLSEDPDAGGED